MSWTKQSKNSTSFNDQSKSSSSWLVENQLPVNQFLLKEDGGYILLETGDKIILEQSVSPYSWSNEVKS